MENKKTGGMTYEALLGNGTDRNSDIDSRQHRLGEKQI
jgi:hypothetical protein